MNLDIENRGRWADKSAIIGIKLKEEERQEAGVSVGASGEWREGVGQVCNALRHVYAHFACGSCKEVMVARGWGSAPLDVSRSTRHAGDHKGPPLRSPPPSPLRTVMSFLIG